MQLQDARHKSSWRKTLATATNAARRMVGVGNYWYWQTLPQLEDGIDIAALVCPLRLDVLVRRDFLLFYTAHRELYKTDFASFLERVRHSSYYTWFMASEALRCKHEMLDNAAELDDAFVSRIHRAARLCDAIETHGFDPRFPIILKTAELLLPPTTIRGGAPTGKQVGDRVFLADGCHRLALLLAQGYTMLPARFFRVKCFREFSPFDSTSLLVRRLNIDAAAYFRFLSSRYCAPFVFERQDDLLQDIATRQPALLNEVNSVIRVDGYATAA